LSWETLLAALVNATKTLSSARLLLFLFLIASASSYFVSNGDPRATLLASLATLALLFVIAVLNIALTLRSSFMRYLAASAAMLAIIIFFAWVLLLSLFALGVWERCIPILGNCPPPTGGADTSAAKAETDFFLRCQQTQSDWLPVEGDERFLPVLQSLVGNLSPGLGDLYISSGSGLYFRREDGGFVGQDIDSSELDTMRVEFVRTVGRSFSVFLGAYELILVDSYFPELNDFEGIVALLVDPNGELGGLASITATDEQGNTIRSTNWLPFAECGPFL
jgi:hypothetical protein